jgi:hypothetical protein
MGLTMFGLTLGMAAVAAQAPTTNPRVPVVGEAIEAAIRQVREGDFEAARRTLEEALTQKAPLGIDRRDEARGLAYLGIALSGLAREDEAKASFLAAAKADPTFRMSPSEFPPRFIEIFDRARADVSSRSAAAQGPRPDPAPRAKGGGAGKGVWLGIGLAAIGGGVALAARGGDGNGSANDAGPTVPAGPTTTTQPPLNVSGVWIGTLTESVLLLRTFQTTLTLQQSGVALAGTIRHTLAGANYVQDETITQGTITGTQVSFVTNQGYAYVATVAGNRMAGTVAFVNNPPFGTWQVSR